MGMVHGVNREKKTENLGKKGKNKPDISIQLLFFLHSQWKIVFLSFFFEVRM